METQLVATANKEKDFRHNYLFILSFVMFKFGLKSRKIRIIKWDFKWESTKGENQIYNGVPIQLILGVQSSYVGI